MATDKLFSPSVARPSLARSHSSLASLCDVGKTTPRDGSPQTQSATQSGLSSPPPMTVAVAFAACECSECGRPLGQSSITFMAYDNKYCSQVCRGRAMSGPRSRGDLVPILSAQRVWYPANAVGCEEQEALRAACAQRPRASPTATPPQRGAVTTLRACSQQRGEDGPDTEASLAEEAAAGSEAALPLQTLHLLKRVDMCSNWRPRRRAAAFRRSCVELLSRCQALLPPRAVRWSRSLLRADRPRGLLRAGAACRRRLSAACSACSSALGVCGTAVRLALAASRNPRLLLNQLLRSLQEIRPALLVERAGPEALRSKEREL